MKSCTSVFSEVMNVCRQKFPFFFNCSVLLTGTNVTLGYDIRDSVNSVDVALDVALDFTNTRERRTRSTNNSGVCECSVNTTEPYVVALIGGARSEISQRVNTVVGASSLPQISYSSTSVSLSDKIHYRCVWRGCCLRISFLQIILQLILLNMRVN